MSDEWDVLADLLEELKGSVPKSCLPEALALSAQFEVARAARLASDTLLGDLAEAGALTDAANDIVRRVEERFQRSWGDLFSRTTALAARAKGKANGKAGAGHLDPEKDRAVALASVVDTIVNPDKDRKSAILDAARAAGVTFSPVATEEAYYRRILRLIANPLEQVEQRAAFSLHLALQQASAGTND